MINSSILYNGNRVNFKLTLDKYKNIISFLTANNILFLSEIKLNIPPALYGNGTNNNLIQYLSNNNDSKLLFSFLRYFMRLIDIKLDDDIKYTITNDSNWQNMNITFYKNIKTTTTTTTITPHIIKYGRLYNWYAATDVRGIAPVGWHVPNNTEWNTLINYSGGNDLAGGKLKEIGTIHWNSPNVATDYFQFKSLGSGEYFNTFENLKTDTKYWIFGLHDYYILFLELTNTDSSAQIFGNGNYNATSGFSIRLIKDNSTNEGDVIIDGDTYHSITIGNQVWLQQNLAVKHYQNGDTILSDFSGTVGAVTAYNNDESNVYY